jgi:hypothetical protein
VSYNAKIVNAEFGIPRALVLVTNPQGINKLYRVPLRDWIAPDGEQYLLLAEFPEIRDMEARYAVNAALLEFQEYQSPFENPGHAE